MLKVFAVSTKFQCGRRRICSPLLQYGKIVCIFKHKCTWTWKPTCCHV